MSGVPGTPNDDRPMKTILRSYMPQDLEALVSLANDPDVSLNMRDLFPSPYTLEDGKAWLALATGDLKDNNFVVEVDGQYAGGAGFQIGKAEEHITAEIGYWLGRRYWGRGIATGVVSARVQWIFEHHPEIIRLQACTYHTNPASARVLEKNGFRLEGVMRRSVTKRGNILDKNIYALLRGI